MYPDSKSLERGFVNAPPEITGCLLQSHAYQDKGFMAKKGVDKKIVVFGWYLFRHVSV